MNLKNTALSLLLLCFAAGLAFAVKVDSPGQAEKESSYVVTGTIVAIYSRIGRDAYYETTHCVAELRVESTEKGEGVKAGDLIYIRYIGDMKWIGKNEQFPGPGPHNNLPTDGEKRKVCLNKNKDGGFDVYYVSGFTK